MIGETYGTGNSSISVAKNAKGLISYEIKLYFFGNTQAVIDKNIVRIAKASERLEKALSMKVEDDSLEAAADSVTKTATGKAGGGKSGGK